MNPELVILQIDSEVQNNNNKKFQIIKSIRDDVGSNNEFYTFIEIENFINDIRPNKITVITIDMHASTIVLFIKDLSKKYKTRIIEVRNKNQTRGEGIIVLKFQK